jgi:hypothetical protein
MHSSSWRRAPTSYIASFCRARLRRFAAHLCKATAAHLRPLLPAALHTKLADSKTHCNFSPRRADDRPEMGNRPRRRAVRDGRQSLCALLPRRDPLDDMRTHTNPTARPWTATMSVETVCADAHLCLRSAVRLLVREATLSEKETRCSARGGHHGRTP